MNKFERAIVWGTPVPKLDLPTVEPPLNYTSAQYKLVRFRQIPISYTPTHDEYVPSPINKRQLVWKPF